MKVLVLDIETRGALVGPIRDKLIDELKPDSRLKDPEKIKADIAAKSSALEEKAALSPLTGQVAIVGLGILETDTEEYTIQTLTAEGEGSEVDLLMRLDAVIKQINPQKLVTFNGREFDLPFLVARCALTGVKTEFLWPIGYNHHHIDLRDALEKGSLEVWTMAIGGPAKTIGGAEIPRMIAEGRWAECAEHCAEDVKWTINLYLRVAKVCDLSGRR